MDKPLDNPPPELKPLLPFIQRANELRLADRVIAYWCCYHAAQLGIGANAKEQTSKLYLLTLMDTLEALKSQLKDNDAVTNDAASAAYVENFALKVFVGADNEDRAGNATRATAKKFLAASHFIELLRVFAELDSEMQSKAKYAKWKAADIAKAFKEGRKPEPGPSGGDPKQQAAEFETAIAGGFGGGATEKDKEEEEAYLAREMAKLTAPTVAGSSEPQAISPSDPSQLNPFDASAENRKRSMSKARMSIHLDGSPLPSPNFSKPLHPQLPRSGSASMDSPANSGSPSPSTSQPAAAGVPRLSTPSDEASERVPPPDAGIDAAGRAPVGWSANGSAGIPGLPLPPSTLLSAASPSTLGGSRPLPVPPPRDGLPIPPASTLHHLGGIVGNESPTGLAGAPGTPQWPRSLLPGSGLPSNVLPSLPVSPGFGASVERGEAGHDGQPSWPSFATDTRRPSFPSTPSAPPLPDAPDVIPSAPHGPGSAPIVHYSIPPQTSPRPSAPSAPVTAAAPVPAASVPETISLKLSSRVQKLAKSAASAVDFEDLDTARLQLRQALDILEGRVKE